MFFNITTPKFAAQAIRKAYDIGWKPLHFLNNVSTRSARCSKPAGLDKSVGLITAAYLKDPTDPQWENDPAMTRVARLHEEVLPGRRPRPTRFNVYGYSVAQTLVQVLKQCGNDLTRENIMKQAANLKDFRVATLLPGIKINTAPDDFAPIEPVQLQRFDGKQWVLFGDVIAAGH